jgi:hypothetical protein
MNTSPSHYSKEFYNYAENFGTPFIPDQYVWNKYLAHSYISCVSNWMPHKKYTNLYGKEFNFELGYVESKNLPNAICGYEENKHVILMYHTFPLMLLEFFHTLLCNKNILTQFGDINSRKNDTVNGLSSIVGFSILTGEVKIKHIDDIEKIFGSNCPIRRQIAFQLYHYAMEFLWEHEVSHVFLGHLHFIQQHIGIESIDETHFNSINNINNMRIFSQLEFSADRGALFNVIIRDLMSYDQRVEMDKKISETGLKVFSCALLGLFFMLSDVVNSGGNMNSINHWGDHPSSLSRALNLVLSIGVHKYPNQNVNQILEKSRNFAAIELVKISDEWGIFKPFRHLGMEGSFDKIFTPNILSSEENKQLNSILSNYVYLTPPLNNY